MEVNQLPWIGMKNWQEPVGWERTQQVTLRYADQMSQISRPTVFLPEVERLPSLHRVCLGKPC